jgi:hypothetical protein
MLGYTAGIRVKYSPHSRTGAMPFDELFCRSHVPLLHHQPSLCMAGTTVFACVRVCVRVRACQYTYCARMSGVRGYSASHQPRFAQTCICSQVLRVVGRGGGVEPRHLQTDKLC